MQSKGIVMLAQNSEHDYVKQACLCAMSIIATNPGTKISLITNDKIEKKYKKFFDKIIRIENDDAEDSEWKVENRWKIYKLSPYDETIVMDTDMLVLQDLSSWWEELSKHELYFTSNVKTYKNKDIVDTYYRKTFIENDLPNLYVGVHYFKKSEKAKLFYELLEQVVTNWEIFYKKHAPIKTPKHVSIDVSVAIVAKMLGWNLGGNKTVSFVHLKSRNQGWQLPSDKWLERLGVYLTKDLELKIGNFRITSVLHYTEKEFVTDEILKIYEENLDVK